MIFLLEFNKPNKMPSVLLNLCFNKDFIFAQKTLADLHLHGTLKH